MTHKPTDSLIELKPCPFCGSDKVNLTVDEHFSREKFGIVCTKCGMDTTGWKDEHGLIELWNTRLSTPVIEGELEDNYKRAIQDLEWQITARICQPEAERAIKALTTLHDELAKKEWEIAKLKSVIGKEVSVNQYGEVISDSEIKYPVGYFEGRDLDSSCGE